MRMRKKACIPPFSERSSVLLQYSAGSNRVTRISWAEPVRTFSATRVQCKAWKGKGGTCPARYVEDHSLQSRLDAHRTFWCLTFGSKNRALEVRTLLGRKEVSITNDTD